MDKINYETFEFKFSIMKQIKSSPPPPNENECSPQLMTNNISHLLGV